MPSALSEHRMGMAARVAHERRGDDAHDQRRRAKRFSARRSIVVRVAPNRCVARLHPPHRVGSAAAEARMGGRHSIGSSAEMDARACPSMRIGGETCRRKSARRAVPRRVSSTPGLLRLAAWLARAALLPLRSHWSGSACCFLSCLLASGERCVVCVPAGCVCRQRRIGWGLRWATRGEASRGPRHSEGAAAQGEGGRPADDARGEGSEAEPQRGTRSDGGNDTRRAQRNGTQSRADASLQHTRRRGEAGVSRHTQMVRNEKTLMQRFECASSQVVEQRHQQCYTVTCNANPRF